VREGWPRIGRVSKSEMGWLSENDWLRERCAAK
jgi:hypothetical protein